MRFSRPIIVLILATLVWGGLFGWSLEQFRELESASELGYQVLDFGKAMIITGFCLLIFWIDFAIRKRSLRMGAFVVGLFIAFFFFYCACLENVGWYVTGTFAGQTLDGRGGGGERIALNPFLHVGGGYTATYFGDHSPNYVYQSSLAPLNMLIYFIYGESIAYLMLFAATRLNRLIGRWRLTFKSRSRIGPK